MRRRTSSRHARSARFSTTGRFPGSARAWWRARRTTSSPRTATGTSCGDQIQYAPDYVINAGGVINGSGEILGRYDPEEAWRRVEDIGPRLEEILRRSDDEGVAPNRVADAMAEEILAAARTLRGRQRPVAASVEIRQ